MYMCVKCIDVVSVFAICTLGFESIPTGWYFVFVY
jgi:hypothetical protein